MLATDFSAGMVEGVLSHGLANLEARVVRPGGLGSLGTWKEPAGAAANLLLAERVAALFPRWSFLCH